ncbi:hypothetical protein AMELA_G00241910 [Ameiurus melas]|uniref:V-SNARE coiled-coil homology domain-containing protein n=1 Tax=Ameiurus melas TaxID=219545 RepID=A0A7J5ZYA0_AMEME|nr:hypothetical protein AMELA_G00241910 [Ameiurus melas]
MSFSSQQQEHRTIMEERQSLVENLHQDLDDVLVIMQENVRKARERGENLEELNHRADKMLMFSRRFGRTTSNLNGNQHQANVTFKGICCGFFFFIIIAVLIVVIIATHKHWI